MNNESNFEISGNWIVVRPDFNLETTPLEIRTNSELESRNMVRLFLYAESYLNGADPTAAGLNIYFDSTLKYYLHYCSGRTRRDFPTSVPTKREKVWRITKTRSSDGIRLQIHCNDVEVLNVLLSDTTCEDSRWRMYWNRKVERMNFNWDDAATDYYRAYAGTCFILVR